MNHSFIVCVYNGQEYIEKCLTSLLNQKYEKEYEIIVIDDASIDDSLSILHKYQKENNNIKVYVNNENMGLSYSRNKGVSNAVGKYISFVDIDDYIHEEYLSTLDPYKYDDVDLIKFNMAYVTDGIIESQTYENLTKEKMSGEQAIIYLIQQKKVFEPTPLYAIKLSYFKENSFEFSIGKVHEDFGLIPFLVSYAKEVQCINDVLYFYEQTPNSITRSIEEDKLNMSYDHLLYFFKKNKEVFIQNEKQFTDSTIDIIFSFMANGVIESYKKLNSKSKKEKVNTLKKEVLPFIQKDTMKQKLKYVVYQFLL